MTKAQMEEAIKTAQAIVDSVTDIRPSLRNKVVASVQHEPGIMTAKIRFTDDSEVRFTGLYAKQILRHLPPVV